MEKRRIAAIDGLRGLAALYVLVFHFEDSSMRPSLTSVMPAWFIEVLRHGYLGVQVFFVLSGFVIAYSTWGRPIDASKAANFVVRRQMRLDPTYWVVLAISIADVALPHILHPHREGMAPLPSSGQVFAHIVYMQHILYGKSISPVFWTLCIEVQFYLVFVACLYLGQRIARFRDLARAVAGLVPVFALGVVSFVYQLPKPTIDGSKWFLNSWFMFALGVFACWVVRTRNRILPFFLAFTIFAMFNFFVWHRVESAVAIGTACVILAAHRSTFVDAALSREPLRYLGQISYSLYLCHYVIGFRVLNAGYAVTGARALPALGWYLAAIAASIGFAHLLYVTVERPTMRFASKLGSKRSTSTETYAAETNIGPA